VINDEYVKYDDQNHKASITFLVQK